MENDCYICALERASFETHCIPIGPRCAKQWNIQEEEEVVITEEMFIPELDIKLGDG